MPYKAPKLCSHQGCGNLVQVGDIYCPDHKPLHKADYKRKHPEYNRLYTSSRWRAYRQMYLAAHPLCVNYIGCHAASTVLDHIKDHDGNYELFWDHTNHQAMCATCHNKKTASTKGWGKEPEKVENKQKRY